MEKEKINLEDDKLENKDIKNEQETVEDKEAREAEEAKAAKEAEDAKNGDDDKKEPAEDPYEKKLGELEKDNKQKSVALIEKNKKIKDLKDDLENQGFDEDKVNELVDKKLEEMKGELGDVENIKSELKEQLDISKKNNINSALKELSENSGERKIYKHFFDTEVNKDLPFEKQMAQAKILGDSAMSDDKFQADVKKANEGNVNTSGKVRADGEVLTDSEKAWSEELFETKEGKAEFERLRSK